MIEYAIHAALLSLTCLLVYSAVDAERSAVKNVVFDAEVISAQLTTATQDVMFRQQGTRLEVAVDKEGKRSVHLANVGFAQFMRAFAPFQAKRVLGRVQAEHVLGHAAKLSLVEYGLLQPSIKLRLQTKSQPLVLMIGDKSYGTIDYYVQYRQQVYLVASPVLQQMLEARTLLYDESAR